MRAVLVTAPTIDPVSVQEVKYHLYIDGSEADAYLPGFIKTAVGDVENDTSRKIITQTWDYSPQCWPDGKKLKIPFGNLQSVTSVKYKDTAGTETTMTATTEYLVETNGDQCGYLVLPYGGTWPSAPLYPSNPITVRFVCGYGATRGDVPETVKQAIKQKCGSYFQGRGDDVVGQTVVTDKTYDRLVNNIPRLYDMDFL